MKITTQTSLVGFFLALSTLYIPIASATDTPTSSNRLSTIESRLSRITQTLREREKQLEQSTPLDTFESSLQANWSNARKSGWIDSRPGNWFNNRGDWRDSRPGNWFNNRGSGWVDTNRGDWVNHRAVPSWSDRWPNSGNDGKWRNVWLDGGRFSNYLNK